MALALLVLPWSNQKIEHMKQQYEKRGDIERVEPGQFQESAGGKRVFFIEKDASGKQAGSNVFIATTENGKETITSARSGRVQHTEQGRFLMLNNGQRLENALDKTELKISEFEEYGIKVDAEVPGSADFVQTNTRPTLELLQNQTLPNLAELSWRIGLILAAMNFVIIGVAVSSANPRVRRGANLVFALFAFILYNNLLNLGQNWIALGKFTFGGFLLALHGGALLLGLLWLAKGHNNWSWLTLSSLWRPTRLISTT
jgi:lipopolysaccharide export system permease protein